MVSEEAIRSFWNWFCQNNVALAGHGVSEHLISHLEERLFAIERLDWEIGPGRNAPNMFSLSPHGDPQLLKLTKHIVSRAPELDGWEFYAAKPSRKWDLVFSIVVDGEEVEVDAKLWEFVVYKFKDGSYDLVFKPNNGLDLSEDDLYAAGIIIVDGEIGEQERMERIKEFDVVRSWDVRAARAARRLESGLLERVFNT